MEGRALRSLSPDVRQLAKYLCEICLRVYSSHDVMSERNVLERIERLIDLPPHARAFASYPFHTASVTQSVVHAIKYTGMPQLGRTTGKLAAARAGDFLNAYDLIIPVPLHRTKFSERGFNQAEALARGLAEHHKSLEVLKSIRRTRPTRSQTTLTLEERKDNVSGVFSAPSKAAQAIAGKQVLLVDDVLTTGSTLASLAEEVLRHKPKSIGFFALAAAERAPELGLE